MPAQTIVHRSRVSTWREILRTCGTAEVSELDPISKWLLVTRACVQPMTLTAGAIAALLAVGHPDLHVGYLALAIVGIVLAHAANNMINDFFDLSAGQDTEAYPRSLYAPHPVNAGIVTRGQLGRAILVTNVLDATIMIVLAVARGWPIVAISLAGLFISVFYVAPPLRFKAHGFGEPSVFLIWGPLMVGGTYLAGTGQLPAEILLASIPYAFLVTTVLFGKHIDKAPWDAPEGVRTLPVIFGTDRALSMTRALMIGFYVAAIALVAAGIYPVWCLICFAALPMLRRALATYGKPKPAEPPARYPLWPLWFGPWAFLHSRRAGALLVMGLALGAVWPVYL
jgi:1,4-dihydroxy-2-naphthoate octaprenyltransferase